MPGFTVFFKTSAVALLCALGIKPNVYTTHNFGDGHDVPGIVGDDVSGDEIDFLGGILNMAAPALAGDSDAVSPASGGKNRLNLNAKHAAIPPDDEVVRFAVAIGFADCESQAGRLDDEDQLRQFALAFGVACRERSWPALGGARFWRDTRLVCHERKMRKRLAAQISPLKLNFEIVSLSEDCKRTPYRLRENAGIEPQRLKATWTTTRHLRHD